jgi:hypothetical protein
VPKKRAPVRAARVDIGDGHSITFAHYEGEVAGANVYHHRPDGAECVGWVAFAGRAWARSFPDGLAGKSWDVVKDEPMTLTPSILCRACGDHGFIQDGRWVKA